MVGIGRIVCIGFLLCLLACEQEKPGLFIRLNAAETGIKFQNKVENSENFNIFNYRNFYNGGGVAVGDINNDDLPDIYLTANMGPNKLYLNKGNFKFEDITEKAGVAEVKKWSTGTVMVDINADGLLDIYVCNAGYQKNIGQENALFINNGDLTFTEKAKEYGLDDNGYTTHAAFLDYDLDGDLDAYILNNSFIPVNTLNYANNRELRAKDWQVKDFLKGGGDKLLRNDKGRFVDVSEEAGIYGSLIGFGLGVTVGDINEDLYPDIYISNDFYENDYLYINQKNGTFTEEIKQRIAHTSLSSMGADMADVNNDGFLEIFVTDMLPLTEERLKTTTSFENHYTYNLKRQKGFAEQFMQNTLQLNNGDGTYSEIAHYAGVNASDWSWGALMFDADNDRKNDIYVCNGILHDVIDQDFIDFFANELTRKMALSGKKTGMQTILDHIPSKPQPNYFFHNEGSLKFKEKGKEFGFGEPSFSNGAAYADFDNDGDLDVIVNNVNQEAFLYKNTIDKQNNYLKLKLIGKGENVFAVGSQIRIFVGDEVLNRQLTPSRGFQSGTEYPLTFGLGDAKKVDSLHVIWPDGKMSVQRKLGVNQSLVLKQTQANEKFRPLRTYEDKRLLKLAGIALPAHKENQYEDFFEERNIPMKLSSEGPAMAIADVNADGFDDIFLGGAKGQISKILIQSGGKFTEKPQASFQDFIDFEDTAASFFDADGDKDQDLYIGSGGNEHKAGARELRDRLYLNNGRGVFSFALENIPVVANNTSVVRPCDFDKDGDIDLFVGSRSIPKVYGDSPSSYLLQNDGKGVFRNIGGQLAPQLKKIGMVRDAAWGDMDGNGSVELVMAGDWMPVRMLSFRNGRFVQVESDLSQQHGFWGGLRLADLNQDGKLDIILGNVGENFAIHPADSANPIKLWINDFDKNGSLDKVMTKTHKQADVPVYLKREMMEQFPSLKNKNLKHAEYAKNTLTDFFSADILKASLVKKINTTGHLIAFNLGNGRFKQVRLPYPVQLSCINGIEVDDINNDGLTDILMVGNFKQFTPQFTVLDACKGNVLLNRGNMDFESLPSGKSGLSIEGEAKSILPIRIQNKKAFIVSINNKSPEIFFKQ